MVGQWIIKQCRKKYAVIQHVLKDGVTSVENVRLNSRCTNWDQNSGSPEHYQDFSLLGRDVYHSHWLVCFITNDILYPVYRPYVIYMILLLHRGLSRVFVFLKARAASCGGQSTIFSSRRFGKGLTRVTI